MPSGKISLLQRRGCDAAGALGRLESDCELCPRYAKMFCTDESFSHLSDALSRGDVRLAFDAVYTIL